MAAVHAAPEQIVASHSGKCLAIPGGTTRDGTRAIQSTCNGVAHQQFSLVPVDEGYFNVVASHSGKCLNVAGARRDNLAPVIQWPCTGGRADNDSWRVEPIGSGHRLVARHSGRCLNVEGGFGANGARLIQYDCVDAGNEIFQSDAFTAILPPEPELDPLILAGSIMAHSSGKCLTVPGSSTANGTRSIQYNCHGRDNQAFSLVAVGGGYFNVVALHSGKCLNVAGARGDNLAPVIQWPCSGGSAGNDSWRVEPSGLGHRLVARHSGRCLNVEGGVGANGARLIQYDCVGDDNEIFTIGALGSSDGGRWSVPIRFPLVPAAAGLLPGGEVLVWSSYSPMGFGGDNGYTRTAIYDPASGLTVAQDVVETGHDMFCPGTSQMGDGRLMVTGGSSAGRVSIFDPGSRTWSSAPEMNRPRAYHSSTALGDGSVVVIGGSWAGGTGDKGAEVFRDGRWTVLSDVSSLPMVGADPRGLYRSDNHMWLFAWSGNQVFQAGPSRTMHMLSTDGTGALMEMGERDGDDYAMNGSATMFDTGRILATGGAPAYDNGQATTNAHVIDIAGGGASTVAVESMRYPRAFHHSVVLPTGEVLVVGGQEVSVPFDDARSALAPELFDPYTNTFRTLAPMRIPRTYHSVALLMLDGRVFVGGGGLCGDCETNHPDAEIFTPPYLVRADGGPAARPLISEAPSGGRYGDALSVRADSDVTEFVLIRLASATHSVNTDQRRVPLSFARSGGDRFSLRLPSDPGFAPPGDYMLFAVDGDGVPSVARVIRLSGS